MALKEQWDLHFFIRFFLIKAIWKDQNEGPLKLIVTLASQGVIKFCGHFENVIQRQICVYFSVPNHLNLYSETLTQCGMNLKKKNIKAFFIVSSISCDPSYNSIVTRFLTQFFLNFIDFIMF